MSVGKTTKTPDALLYYSCPMSPNPLPNTPSCDSLGSETASPLPAQSLGFPKSGPKGNVAYRCRDGPHLLSVPVPGFWLPSP